MEEEQFDTIVGEDVNLTGSISNSGSILINGTVKGDITSKQAVVIGQNAKVEGPINGLTVQVAGNVEGAIVAQDTLEMLPESIVNGDIKASTLHIQPGAKFNGNASMTESTASPEKEGEPAKEAAEVETEDEDDFFGDKESVKEPAGKAKPKLEVEG